MDVPVDVPVPGVGADGEGEEVAFAPGTVEVDELIGAGGLKERRAISAGDDEGEGGVAEGGGVRGQGKEPPHLRASVSVRWSAYARVPGGAGAGRGRVAEPGWR